jgi:hypothetical protein
VIVGGALGLVALAPLPASAQQQVAANGAVPQNVSISPQCAGIKDIALQTACEIQRRDAADLVKIRATREAALTDQDCTGRIKTRLAEGKINPQELSNYLNNRRMSDPAIGGSCKVLERFTPKPN